MRKITTIKERLLQFIENQGIKKEEFYSKIGIDGANFRGKNLHSEFSVDKVVKILRLFPQISIEWLLFGDGEMISPLELQNGVTERPTEYMVNNIDYKEKYCEVLEKYYQLSEENKHLRSLLEKNKKLNSQHAQDATV